MSQYVYTINGKYYLINTNSDDMNSDNTNLNNICRKNTSNKNSMNTSNKNSMNTGNKNICRKNMCSKNSSSNKIIETLIDSGNVRNIDNSVNVDLLTELDDDIDQSTVINGITEMLSSVINNVTSNNQADIARLMVVSNQINISNIKATNINFTNIKQTINISSDTIANIQQDITTKIINDIKNEIENKIINKVENQREINKTENKVKQDGTNLGDILNTITEETAGVITDFFTISSGNTLNEDNSTNYNETLRENYRLDESFTLTTTQDSNNTIEYILSQENMAKCVEDTQGDNMFTLTDAEIEGTATFDTFDQTIQINDIMKCAFNQTILNEISTNIANDFVTNINNGIKARSTYETKKSETDTTGDLYAGGVFMRDMFGGIGGAIESTGTAVSTAITGGGIVGIVMIAILFLAFIGYYFRKSLFGRVFSSSSSNNGDRDHTTSVIGPNQEQNPASASASASASVPAPAPAPAPAPVPPAPAPP